VQHLPANPAPVIAPIAGGAVAGTVDDASQLLGVELDEAARRGVLVADDGSRSALVADSPRRRMARCTLERARPSTAAMRSGPQPVVVRNPLINASLCRLRRCGLDSGRLERSCRPSPRATCQRGSQR